MNLHLKRIVEVSLSGLSSNTKRAYQGRIDLFLSWLELDQEKFSRDSVQRYLSIHCSSAASVWNQSIAAVKKLSSEAAANGWISRDDSDRISTIQSKTERGSKAGVWLTRTQAKEIIRLPDPDTLRGARDSAVLHLLLGSGVRRFELSGLRWNQLRFVEDRWRLMNIVGKGGRIRTITLPDWCVASLFQWAAWMMYVDSTSFSADSVIRRSFRWRSVKRRLSESAVRNIVVYYSSLAKSRCAPHDLRRTYGKLARKGNAPIELIRDSLGHASVQTTEKYIGAGEEANAGDFIFLDLEQE